MAVDLDVKTCITDSLTSSQSSGTVFKSRSLSKHTVPMVVDLDIQTCLADCIASSQSSGAV